MSRIGWWIGWNSLELVSGLVWFSNFSPERRQPLETEASQLFWGNWLELVGDLDLVSIG